MILPLQYIEQTSSPVVLTMKLGQDSAEFVTLNA
jgi:hypothetical protein